ncbi:MULTISPECIES: carboxylate--amine ligase [Peptoniphilus]|jgi:ATP-grasp superfamily protein|uniref:carboxylate--amine ligase n=1 Tax=Peptoniphilus TaxID=162289 RepID=UPI00028924C0|nr:MULTISPECIES: carboxylate--amine ligase [Peptoniphilus]MDU1044245.1 carboxylate--amine ligase [Peptoniphilus rhinitidis]MDU1955375.1 carboxylate--amine ligase [Peptoniphilus lacydonensis]MDU3751161.1 carboxylate--amine ligase [Peptoniphilus rhinitidis]MDU5275717.1 carboxylate--amine ligase [Peptoniphilus lacydonensis]MDU7302967.1 carboxylate--amine ligase [Peptoniphilus lacydonensis]
MKNISKDIIKKFKVKFVILGSDENAYGVARILNDNYGLISTVFCQKPLPATDNSKILDRKIINNFSNDKVFVDTMINFAKDNNDSALITIPCGDEYSKLLSNNKDKIKKYYKFNTPSTNLNEKLENKIDFYKSCEEMDIPYPKFTIINNSKEIENLNLQFPLILKPNDSISYVKLSFPNKYKVYTIYDFDELKSVVKTIYDENNYEGTMLVQEYIPGPASNQASFNVYCDKNAKVRMMVYGQILLADPLPLRIGNNDAIYTKYMPELFDFYKEKLESINYTGFSNIDLKYDPRDNTYKAFEMNLRLPQSHYFMAAGGVNVLDFYIRDLLDLGFEEDVYYHKETSKIWMNAHPKLLKEYTDERYHATIDKLLKNGYEFTINNKKDFSFSRKKTYLKRKYGSIKHYKMYYKLEK